MDRGGGTCDGGVMGSLQICYLGKTSPPQSACPQTQQQQIPLLRSDAAAARSGWISLSCRHKVDVHDKNEHAKKKMCVLLFNMPSIAVAEHRGPTPPLRRGVHGEEENAYGRCEDEDAWALR